MKVENKNNFSLDLSFFRKSIGLSFVSMLGKIFGFVKQSVIAWAFGANSLTDIYFAADSYIAMFGQIQKSSISPVVLTEYIYSKENNDKNANVLLTKCYLAFLLIAIVLMAINILFSKQISIIFGISYSSFERNELQRFIILLCPIIIITALIGVSQGVLEGNNSFIPGSLLSFFFSLSIIISILLFRSRFGIYSMLLGFLVGYAFYSLYLVVLSTRYFSFCPLRSDDYPIYPILKKTFPLVVGNSIIDIGHIVDKIIASSLDYGSISYLYYGQVASNDIVTSVFITSIGMVLLPTFTNEICTSSDKKGLISKLNNILCIVTTVLMFVTSLYALEGLDFIVLLFERGNFTHEAAEKVSYIVVAYAIGFVFIAIRDILTKVSYAFQDTKTPMKNSIVGCCVNIALSIILSRIIGATGVAIATSISMMVVSFAMCLSLKKNLGENPLKKVFWVSFFKSLISMVLATIISLEIKQLFIITNSIIRILVVSIMLLLIYLLFLFLFKYNFLSLFHIFKKDNSFD